MISNGSRRGLIAFFMCAVLAVLAMPHAHAQQPETKRVRGVIDAVSADSVTVTRKDGTTQVVQLAPNLVISALVAAKLSDIKPGVFIGATARPGPDGALRASEVHIFPESMRGAGEGHYPWDTDPDASMTNASVSDIVTSVKGSTLSLTYKGGETEVTVTPATSIVAVTAGTRDDLKKGASIFSVASEAPDGALKTGFLLVGRGVSPPM
jgi:hypothetical protein